MNQELIIVGDRVLIEPDDSHDRTDTGLYLPQGVKEKEKVQSGTVVKIGPGYPIPDPSAIEAEPWETPSAQKHYFPLQAKEGDFCIFLRNAAVEIEYRTKKYLVVPHAAILVILRGHGDDLLEGTL